MISDDNHAQISDFGIAHIVDVPVEFTRTINNNDRFEAPELMGTDSNPQLSAGPTFESDIYSLALLFLQVSLNILLAPNDLRVRLIQPPFDKLFHGPDKSKTRGLPYNHIWPDTALAQEIVDRGARPLRERYNRIADQHWNLMKSCWTTLPNERPSITQVFCKLHALTGR